MVDGSTLNINFVTYLLKTNSEQQREGGAKILTPDRKKHRCQISPEFFQVWRSFLLENMSNCPFIKVRLF